MQAPILDGSLLTFSLAALLLCPCCNAAACPLHFQALLFYCLLITKCYLRKKTEEARDGLKEPPSGQFDWYYLSKLTSVLILPHALLENRLFQCSLSNSFSSSIFEARDEEERLDVRAEVVGFS